MTTRRGLTIALNLLSTALSLAAEPRQDTVRAWDDYILTFNLNMAERAAGEKPFLWADDSPEIRERVRHDQVVIAN